MTRTNSTLGFDAGAFTCRIRECTPLLPSRCKVVECPRSSRCDLTFISCLGQIMVPSKRPFVQEIGYEYELHVLQSSFRLLPRESMTIPINLLYAALMLRKAKCRFALWRHHF